MKSEAGCDHYLYNFNVLIPVFLMEVTYLFFPPFFPPTMGKISSLTTAVSNSVKTAVSNSVNKCLSNYRDENWLLKKSPTSSQISNIGCFK